MKSGAAEFKDWTWGHAHADVVPWNDPDVDAHLNRIHGRRNRKGSQHELVACGRLVEIHFREPHKDKDTVLRLSSREANNSLLMFDPNHANERLYIKLAPSVQARMKKNYAQPARYKSMPLAKVAKAVGGRHGRKVSGRTVKDDYPPVSVMPLGVWTHVVYAVEKGTDTYSKYIHAMGEETNTPPVLTVDAKGRLWSAGGNYRCLTAGITD